MGNISVTIVNWSKYNSETDKVRHPYWFKVHKKIISSASLFGLSPAQKWFWIYLLSEAADKFHPKIELDINRASHSTFLTKKQILEAVEILKLNGALTVKCQSTDSKVSVDRHLSRIEKSKEEESKEEYIKDFDFEKVYEGYPRKEGKTEGLKKCHTEIKTEVDYNNLEKAVAKYSKTCREERREKKYIKQFSSFMSIWRDYIPKQEEKKEMPKPDNWHTPEQLNKTHLDGPGVDVRELRKMADVTEIWRKNAAIK